MRRLRSTDDYSGICLSLSSRRLLLATKVDVNQILFSWVAAKCSVGLHGALFSFSLKLRKRSPIKNTVNKPPL